MNDRFLRACRREQVDCTPIWLMRQAGRYLPEYRQLREKHAFLTMIRRPELAVEVTLQPLRRFPLDAAIIFADLLPPLIGMGIDLDYAAGEGPVIANPVRRAADVEKLRVPPPEENVPFTLEAIRLARQELESKLPLIGFAGAPFTLASYLVEGGSSRDQARTKAMMHHEPAAWGLLMERLAELMGNYLQAQVRAGAQAVQVFDSWAGSLSPADYRDHVLPHSRRVIDTARAAGAPVIHFSTGTAGMLELIREAGGHVIGVDWRADLDVAWRRIGGDVAIQGNLDPAILSAPRAELLRRAADILERAGGRPGHIFNLGHGILPGTPPENVAALVDFVHGSQG
jgi:uroporphyrinogen decarboxylase